MQRLALLLCLGLGASAGSLGADSAPQGSEPDRPLRSSERRVPASARDQPQPEKEPGVQPGALDPSPTLGAAALTVDQQIHLGPASHSFKDGKLYQWSDAGGNNSLGRDALRSNTIGVWNNALGRSTLEFNTEGYSNTAIGDYAMRYNTLGLANTAVGDDALRSNTLGHSNTVVGEDAMFSNQFGFENTAVGRFALRANTEGFANVALGLLALGYNTTGAYNVAAGHRAMWQLVGGQGNVALGAYTLTQNQFGFYNIAIGSGSGQSISSHSNIMINNPGVVGDANTLRIGSSTGTGSQDLDKAFIHGIHGRTVSGGIGVLIKSDGQLGTTTSSRRFKEEIADIGQTSEVLHDLRPVSFRFKEQAAGAGERPLEFGLIAEEVAEIYPELVVYDEQGEPHSVRYHLLTPMLLNEVQRLRRELEQLRREVAGRN